MNTRDVATVRHIKAQSEAGIEEAWAMATRAHNGQIDKGGNPYLLHPMRVALRFTKPTERIVAILHDVVEDSEITIGEIRDKFGPEVADAVDGLTRRDGETYEAFIGRCAANPLARAVKLADLADNMDTSRLHRALTRSDELRIERYRRARVTLADSYGRE